MISSSRLGDSHVCPLPGYGTTPIASASSNVLMNGMPHRGNPQEAQP